MDQRGSRPQNPQSIEPGDCSNARRTESRRQPTETLEELAKAPIAPAQEALLLGGLGNMHHQRCAAGASGSEQPCRGGVGRVG